MNPTAVAGRWKWVALTGLLTWAYFPTLSFLWDNWMNLPQYSHGILVPFFSAYLLYRRKETMATHGNGVAILGFAALALAFIMRLGSAVYANESIDAVSMLVAMTGVVFLVGGWTMFRWSWPAIAFLVFAVPLPYQLEIAMGGPLQHIATEGSTFVLQTMGQPAISEGNTILINDSKLEVANACSGLRMLMTFFAFSCGAVFLMQRSWVEKVIVVMSAVPIALATNIIRIVMTGFAYIYLGHMHGIVDFLHDAYGWLMMPIGLVILLTEVWILSKLFIMPEVSPTMRRR